jgi:hypothetical protein
VQTSGIGAVVKDFCTELMTHVNVSGQVHHGGWGHTSFARGLDHQLAILKSMQIGTADPARVYTHEDLTGERLRFGYRVNDDLGIAHYCCPHDLSSLSILQNRGL